MNNMRNKILSLLALLLTAASGAWATAGVKLTTAELVPTAAWNGNYDDLALSDMPGLTADGITEEQAKAWADVPKSGMVDLIYGYEEHETYMDFKIITFSDGEFVSSLTTGRSYHNVYFNFNTVNVKTYYATGVAEPPLTVDWNASTKTGTFSMPGSNVVLTPQYAPTAKWDVVETVEQKPAALEGIIAGQDKAIVTAGQSAQGTVMYAVTTTAEAAPALTAFSATVPTAKTYDDAATLYVWYYIKGTDTPDGQEATAENTFNDSEICAEPLKVDILTNKFDLTLSPTKADKISVEVNGTAQTPTEGKLKNVKMQSEVKLKAADGYKFRKVEVKKGEAGPPEYYDKLTVTVRTQGQWSCASGPQATFIGQTITEEQAIALAKYQASKTNNNTVVFYKKESWQMYYAKSDGTTSYGDVATSMGLDGYDVYYVAQ